MYGLTGVLDPELEEFCTDSLAATSIYEHLVGLSDLSASGSRRSVSCNGKNWHMERCLSNGVAVCIGCWDPCYTSHREIPPMALFMNPCSPNMWRPDSNVRMIQFHMKDTVFPATITSIGVVDGEIDKSSITIDVVVEFEAYVYCRAFESEGLVLSAITLFTGSSFSCFLLFFPFMCPYVCMCACVCM